MTPDQAAKVLDGRQYRKESEGEIFKEMKEHGLVAVFGASDDLMEFEGAIYDEFGCFDGGTALLDEHGLLEECDCDCSHYRRAKANAKTIKAVWGEEGVSWTYETDIPHASFTIYEDGEPYCVGLVFDIKDLK